MPTIKWANTRRGEEEGSRGAVGGSEGEGTGALDVMTEVVLGTAEVEGATSLMELADGTTDEPASMVDVARAAEEEEACSSSLSPPSPSRNPRSVSASDPGSCLSLRSENQIDRSGQHDTIWSDCNTSDT